MWRCQFLLPLVSLALVFLSGLVGVCACLCRSITPTLGVGVLHLLAGKRTRLGHSMIIVIKIITGISIITVLLECAEMAYFCIFFTGNIMAFLFFSLTHSPPANPPPPLPSGLCSLGTVCCFLAGVDLLHRVTAPPEAADGALGWSLYLALISSPLQMMAAALFLWAARGHRKSYTRMTAYRVA